MSIHHLLEDFGGLVQVMNGSPVTASENELLDSFEQGYKAGWEDAVRAKSEERTSISVDLARNLQDLSFTYHEAHAAVLADMAPVFEQIVMKILPQAAQETLGWQIVEQLTELAGGQDPQNGEITVSPNNYEAVAAILPENLPFPVDLIQDASLSEGQSQIRLGSRERQIDLGEVLQGLSQAFAGFVHQSRKEVVNG